MKEQKLDGYELFVQAPSLDDQAGNYRRTQGTGIQTVTSPTGQPCFVFTAANAGVQYHSDVASGIRQLRLRFIPRPTGGTVIDGTLLQYTDIDNVQVIVETINNGAGIKIIADDVGNRRIELVENFSDYRENSVVTLLFEGQNPFTIAALVDSSEEEDAQVIYHGNDVWNFRTELFQLGFATSGLDVPTNRGSRVYSLIAYSSQ